VPVQSRRGRVVDVELIKRIAEHMRLIKDAILAFAIYTHTVDFWASRGGYRCDLVGGRNKIFANTWTLGVLVAFMQYAHRFYGPIQDLSEKFNILQSAMGWPASERSSG